MEKFELMRVTRLSLRQGKGEEGREERERKEKGKGFALEAKRQMVAYQMQQLID